MEKIAKRVSNEHTSLLARTPLISTRNPIFLSAAERTLQQYDISPSGKQVYRKECWGCGGDKHVWHKAGV